jgi:oligopeptidase B
MTSATPRAPRRDFLRTRVTGDVNDPYAWLLQKEDPDTVQYLQAENANTDEFFASHADTVESIFQEIKSRVKEDDSSYPVLHRGWWYASRTETGKSYAIHSRGKTAETASDIVLLDENIEAAGADYFSLSAFDISHNGHLLAWSSDVDGSEMYTLRIRDLTTGAELSDEIPNTTWGGTAWSQNDEWLFYVTADEAMRPDKVWRHQVGTPASHDVVVLEEPDERFFVGVGSSRSGEWIIIDSSSKTSSECWVINAAAPTLPPQSIAPRRDDVEYQVDHWGDVFAITTNLNAVDFQVMTAPLDQPSVWSTLIEHIDGQRITQFDCFHTFAVMQRWIEGQQVISVVSPTGSGFHHSHS